MSDVLTQLSHGLADVVSAVEGALVRVEARRRLPASGIVWSADGLILTANHVVRQDEGIQVGLADGRTVAATLVGRDPSTDLALLRVEATDLAPLPLASDIRVGHLVLALGRPGRTAQATLGIVSALGDSWQTRGGGRVDQYLQTDVVMYPGFSGGPLVNAAGELLGLNSSGLASGVSLALPTATLDRVATTLGAHGRIKRGYLGVSMQRVHLPEELKEALGQKSGLLIVSVEPGSPAADGGVLLGDTIVALDGQAVSQHEALMALLVGDRVGQKVPLTVIRGGEKRDFNVKIGERGA